MNISLAFRELNECKCENLKLEAANHELAAQVDVLSVSLANS